MLRMKLLAAMIMLTAVIVLVVFLGSPYEPVVGPVTEIETIWEIEDARTESEKPLINRLTNHGIPLAHDAQSNTFYCTLGMGQSENWPDIHLHAPGADGVSLMFVDDYTYDFCADAIRAGYPYQVMAYTDTEFAYFDVVFTGMKQIHVNTYAEIGKEDIPANVALLDEMGVLESYARVHHRGNATLLNPKKGLKIEFTRNSNGTHKIERDVPEIGNVHSLALLPLYADATMMRDRLCWAMYADMVEEGESFGERRTAYAEVFINDKYEGVYLVLEPYDNVEELSKYSSRNPETDSVYRVSWMKYGTDRPTHPGAYAESRAFELYYTAPKSQNFADLKTYIEISEEEDDALFAQKAAACMNTEAAARYVLLLQGLGLTDNVFNNLNIWARHDRGKVIYHYFPWDLDNSLGKRSDRIGGEYEKWMYLPAADRMISLDVNGIRQRMLDMWINLRENGWSIENVENRINHYTEELNDSGAFLRNAQRWNMEEPVADGYEIITFISTRFPMLDQVLSNFAKHEGKIDMLDYTDYINRSCSLTEWFSY